MDCFGGIRFLVVLITLLRVRLATNKLVSKFEKKICMPGKWFWRMAEKTITVG